MPDSNSFVKNPKIIARIWVFLTLVLIFFFFSLTKWSYFKLDAIIVWILTGIAVLFISHKIKRDDVDNPSWKMIFLGLSITIFSFINIPMGFGNPPYSIGDFMLLLSGGSLIFFGYYGYRSFLIPIILPSIAVIGFQFFDKMQSFIEIISEPLIPPIVTLTTLFLHVTNIDSTIKGNAISFLSLSGDHINLIVTENCSGIWSLGTFTITCLIVLASFPQARTGKGLLLILVGYLGTFATNILRIWFIILVGYYFGSYAAIKSAHDYMGWLIFSAWVIVFWYYFISHHLKISLLKQNQKRDDIQ